MTTKPVVGQRLFDSGTVASEELRTQLQRARVTLDFVADAIVSTDLNGQVDFINDAAERLLGRTMSAARGRGIDELFSLHSVETHAALANPIHRCLDHGRPIERSGGSLLSVAGQTPVLVRERVVPVRDDSGRVLGAVLVLHDLSRESGLSEQLNWRQQHDALTGLLNREEFERRLQFEVERLRGGTVSSTLLYLDIDRFRVINDTAGHLAGDRLLIEVARRVQEQIRGSDLCARFGDDEFAVLLRDCDARNALAIANQLRNDFEIHRFGWRSRVFRYTGSIGLVQIEPGMDCGTVLAAADVACFAAKDAGRNAVTLYSADETPSGYRDMKWVERLGRACDEEQFRLYCQPIVPIGTSAKVCPHFELLLRIHDDDGDVIGPTDFLPAAERFNLMPTIDRWVVRHVLAHLARRRSDTAIAPYTVSVNLSGTSLSDRSFLDFAVDELQKADLAENALCFEITETAAIENIAEVVRFMSRMRALGCEFSLDDFGSGLSSFAYLKELPVDYLKIDGRFVRNLQHDRVDKTMVGAISHIGNAIGVRTVAERVENGQTLHQLQSLGIDFAQGYYFSRPVPARDRQFLSDFDVRDATRPLQTA